MVSHTSFTSKQRLPQTTFDAALELRPFGVAIAATTAEPPISFVISSLTHASLVVIPNALTGADAANYWDLILEASNDGTTYQTVLTQRIDTNNPLPTELAFSGYQVAAVAPDRAKFTRIRAVKTGVVGNLNYQAFLSFRY